MFKKFLSLSNLTLLVALSLSTTAAYYSIIGLTAIFAGAVIPIIIMGSILEIGKITATVWLRKYWDRAGWVLKLYLVPAVVALALLTSMGIFGFLSKAHMDQGITSGDVQAKIAIYDEKIKVSQDNIDVNRKALKQLDEAVDQVMGRSTSETGADKAVAIRKSQAKERTRLLAEIAAEQKTITGLREERAPIAAEVRKVEAEVGPIKYIAALIYGDNTDTNTLEAAVRWVIILLVIVFDPLAIALVLAANQSKEWDKEEPSSPKESLPEGWPFPAYEPDDGPLNEEQIEQVIESVESPQGEVITKDELFPEPEKSVLEQHPYLTKPFSHFSNTVPMVAKTEEPVVEEKPKKKRVKKEKVVPAPEIVAPIFAKNVVKKPRKTTPKKTPEIQPEIVEPVVEFTDTERPGDYITPPENEVLVMPTKPYKDIDGTYIMYNGKHMNKDVLKNDHPELFTLKADAEFNTPISTSFGIKFPDNAKKGDIFVRVDMLPNRVYKQDGNGRWIEVNKNNSDTYLHNQKYIEHLISMLDKGQYDPELLSDSEREQIERHIKRSRKI